jgi:predicted RNase H-like HicB family nuclease
MSAEEFFLELEVERLEEGGYLATSTVLPGLVAQGRTVAETIEIAQDVARRLIESYAEHNDPLPKKLAAAIRKQRRKSTIQLSIGIPAELAST